VTASKDRLLLFALEAARADQIDALLAIAGKEGVPLSELVQKWSVPESSDRCKLPPEARE